MDDVVAPPPPIRGISLVTGAHDEAATRRILRAIRQELHCTHVMLMDSDVDVQSPGRGDRAR